MRQLLRSAATISAGALAAAGVLAVPPGTAGDRAAEQVATATVDRVCTACHDDRPLQVRRSATEWNAIVNAMVARGAQATPEELSIVKAYLAKNRNSSP